MTLLFLLALEVMGLVMKLVVYLQPVTLRPERPEVFWLLLSPPSNRRLRPVESVGSVFLRAGAVIGGAGLGWWFVRWLGVEGEVLSYCAVPVLLLMSEGLVMVMTLLWLPSGRVLPRLHERPWAMRGVGDFWGRRWNLWFSDWCRYAVFQRMRRRPVLALLVTFLVSGVLHEWVVNVPLYLVTGKAVFGTMMGYFLLQAGGVMVERRLKNWPRARRIFAWLVVVGPAPLVVNEGLLRAMGLWVE